MLQEADYRAAALAFSGGADLSKIEEVLRGRGADDAEMAKVRSVLASSHTPASAEAKAQDVVATNKNKAGADLMGLQSARAYERKFDPGQSEENWGRQPAYNPLNKPRIRPHGDYRMGNRDDLERMASLGDEEAAKILKANDFDAAVIGGGVSLGASLLFPGSSALTGMAGAALAGAAGGATTAALERRPAGDIATRALAEGTMAAPFGMFAGALGKAGAYKYNKLRNPLTNDPGASFLRAAEDTGYETTFASPGVRARPGTAASAYPPTADTVGAMERDLGAKTIAAVKAEGQANDAAMDAQRKLISGAAANKNMTSGPLLRTIRDYWNRWGDKPDSPVRSVIDKYKDYFSTTEIGDATRIPVLERKIKDAGGDAFFLPMDKERTRYMMLRPRSMSGDELLSQMELTGSAADMAKLADESKGAMMQDMQKTFYEMRDSLPPEIQAEFKKRLALTQQGIGVEQAFGVTGRRLQAGNPADVGIVEKRVGAFGDPRASATDRDAINAFIGRNPDLEQPYNLFAGVRGAEAIRTTRNAAQEGVRVLGGVQAAPTAYGAVMLSGLQMDPLWKGLKGLLRAAPPAGAISGDLLSKYVISPETRAKLQSVYGDAITWNKDRISAIISDIEGTKP